jgi:2-polyprenyl-3-methyl-5-hydroxy-6-metoxy-1,4-benzoquinol methylase
LNPPEPNPAFVFETLNAHQRSAALRGAIELELFSAIARGHRDVESLAAACQASERGVRILCDYLVVIEFLLKRDQQYELTPASAAFLDQQSPHYMGDVARFINSPDLLDSFRDVAELVRRGSTMLPGAGTVERDYRGWVEFARSMVPMMSAAAEFVGLLAADDGPRSMRVLDVAAGHGLFGIAVAKQNPQARIVALDWEAVLQVAHENAAAAGILDRYRLLPGDALEMDYGDGFDLVLLTNFLHHFDRAACQSILGKVRRCLQPSGRVITLEFVPNEDRVSPAAIATFGFTMLATTPGGEAYTFAEYDHMFRASGFGESRMMDVPRSTQRVIVTQGWN